MERLGAELMFTAFVLQTPVEGQFFEVRYFRDPLLPLVEFSVRDLSVSFQSELPQILKDHSRPDKERQDEAEGIKQPRVSL